MTVPHEVVELAIWLRRQFHFSLFRFVIARCLCLSSVVLKKVSNVDTNENELRQSAVLLLFHLPFCYVTVGMFTPTWSLVD